MMYDGLLLYSSIVRIYFVVRYLGSLCVCSSGAMYDKKMKMYVWRAGSCNHVTFNIVDTHHFICIAQQDTHCDRTYTARDVARS